MSKICLQRGLSSAGPTAAAVGTLEEKLAALEKSRDYNTGLNNLQTDNVAIPPRAIGYVNHINFIRFQGTFLYWKYFLMSLQWSKPKNPFDSQILIGYFGFVSLLQYPRIGGIINLYNHLQFLQNLGWGTQKRYCFISSVLIFVFVLKHFLRSHTHSHLSLATSVGNRSVTSMWRERYYNLFWLYFFSHFSSDFFYSFWGNIVHY